MNIIEIIDRNYAATVRRGLIKPETTKQEFVDKLEEEITEFIFESYGLNFTEMNEELADVILVCLAYAKHFNIDILSELEKKTLFNETRK